MQNVPVSRRRSGRVSTSVLALALAPLLAAACGGGGGGGGGGGAAAGGGAGGDAAAGGAAQADHARGLGLALVGPRLVTAGVMESRTMVTEAVYFATQQTGSAALGRVTNTGTVQVTQFGAVYQPSPNDRLVVVLGQQRHEFTGVEAVGDGTQQFAANWLAAPHRLAYTHRIAEKAEVHIAESYDGRGFVATVDGWTTIAGQRCELKLETRGGTQGGTDMQGADRTMRYQLTGTMRAAGVAIDVKEQHVHHFVSSQDLTALPSQRGSASRTLSQVDSTAHVGGADYAFASVQAESGTKEKGGNTTGGVVALAGRITRNGKPFADCSLQGGVPVAVTANGVLSLLDL